MICIETNKKYMHMCDVESSFFFFSRKRGPAVARTPRVLALLRAAAAVHRAGEPRRPPRRPTPPPGFPSSVPPKGPGQRARQSRRPFRSPKASSRSSGFRLHQLQAEATDPVPPTLTASSGYSFIYPPITCTACLLPRSICAPRGCLGTPPPGEAAHGGSSLWKSGLGLRSRTRGVAGRW